MTNTPEDKLFDYTSVGFYTFDCLGRPVNEIPPGANTYFIDELTLAVSGAAGSAAIVAAKHGLKVQAIGGVGKDDMGDWVLQKLQQFDVDTTLMQVCEGVSTSSSIVTTRPNGDRPALHKRGATSTFTIDDDKMERAINTRILHVGGVGLMDTMDTGRTEELMRAAKQANCTTTLDVFAATQEDYKLIKPLLPYTDYFMPSEEEARALSGLHDLDEIGRFLIDDGVGAVVLTLGPDGACYMDRDGKQFSMPAYDIDVVCTCGCGDCFNAGFATGIHLGKSVENCVQLGEAASAQNAMGLGSQAVLSSLEETLKFLESTPFRAS